MAERLASKYKNNIIASKKKHIFSRLLDYFSLFVVTYLLFSVLYPLGSNLPVVNNNAKKLQDQNAEIAEFIDSTHLQRLSEDRQSLISIDSGANDYVKNLCKTSAYIYDLTFPVKNEDGTFSEVAVTVEETFANEVESYALDTPSYYFKVFKKSEASLNNYVYEDVDYKDDIDTYLYLKIMKVDASKFVSSDNEDLLAKGNGISHYVVLTKENTTTLLRYFKEDRADTSLYNEIYNNYVNASNYGINDIESNSNNYAALINTYTEIYQSLIMAILIIYLIAYVLAYVLLTVIVRLVSKEWVTLGQKVMGLAMCATNEMETSAAQLVFYHILNAVLFFTSSLIGFYFMGMVGVLSFKIGGVVPILGIFLGLLVINMASLFMPFFVKNNHDFASLAARINVKDVTEFEGSADKQDVSDKEYEEQNGTSEQQQD